MTATPNPAPPRRAMVAWIVLVLTLIGAIWYYFLGPGVKAPWPWEVHWTWPRFEGRR